MRRVSLLVVLLASACFGGGGRGTGGGGDGGPAGCVQPTGVYDVAFVELAGTCGPQDPVAVEFSMPCDSPDLGPTCRGSRVCSGDRCTITIDATCSLDATRDVRSQVAIEIGAGADRLSGEVGLCILDAATGSDLCCSRYAAVWTRR